MAITKVSQPFWIILIKGIGANWLVCLAVWAGLAAKSAASKLMALWFPITTFIVLGFEHSIANMFFIPLAMFQGTDISVGQLFVDNLIPATLGNIIGGFVFVGCSYGYIYKKKIA